jgi:hypothetical protein
MGVSVFPAASGGASVAEGNAAGWGSNAWIQLAAVNAVVGTTNYSFTGLSGYRKLRFGVTGIETSGSGGTARLVFNGDSGSNYSWTNTLMQNNQTSPFRTIFGNENSNIVLCGIAASGYVFHTVAEIDNVSGTHKPVRHRSHVSGEDYYWANNPTSVEGFATWRNNTAINQIEFLFPSTNNTVGRIHIWGQV